MNGLELDWMLTIDETGMPKTPTLKQLLDRDVSLLYTRDKSPNKEMYIKEVGVIYYLGDPKGPCLQEGLSEKEALKKLLKILIYLKIINLIFLFGNLLKDIIIKKLELVWKLYLILSVVFIMLL